MELLDEPIGRYGCPKEKIPPPVAYIPRPEEDFNGFIEGVNRAAERAYALYSHFSGARQVFLPTHQGFCVQNSLTLQYTLEEAGLPTQLRAHRKQPPHFWLCTTDTEEMYFIDPTWQQYLPPERRGYYERVLIQHPEAVAAHVAAVGVPERRQQLWLDSYNCPKEWWAHWRQRDPNLRRLFV